MKKVLALVLALTMVLGFAATASAYWNFDYELFTNAPRYTVDGTTDTEFEVDGNKEYKIKAEFTDDDIVPSYVVDDTVYDGLYADYQVLDILETFYANKNNRNWTNATIVRGNAMYDAVDAAGIGGSDLWTTFRDVMSDPQSDGTATTFEEAYESATLRSAIRELRNNPYYSYYYNNSYYGLAKGIVATASSSDSTYATVTSQPTIDIDRDVVAGETTYTVEFKVRFTNTTFRTADVDIDINYQAGGSTQQNYYSHKDTLSFTVFQAQYRTFTEQDALIAFGVTPNVEISADDYAYISADAFRLMLQNSSRSITVVSGMGDSKVRFDKDSTNLPQDVFVGNFTTSANSDSVSINGFSSTTSAKIKIAVGRSFYNANNGKVISVYDANGNKLDVEATLQGDYTVNFYAPLSNYTVAGTDWAGQTVPSTDAGKNNPSMGGAF